MPAMTYPPPRTVEQRAPRPRPSRLPKYLTILAAVLVLLTGAVLVLVALTPAGGSPANFFGLGNFRVSGSVTLTDSYARGQQAFEGQALPTDDCWGSGGYADIKRGTQVTVTDANGKVIALGQLGGGRVSGTACVLLFALDVPAGQDFYGVEIAHRGAVRYTVDQMHRQLSLGLG
jgi:hypothetical protein